MRTTRATALAATLAFIGVTTQPAAAAERPDNLTIVMNGRFTAHNVAPHTPPGRATTLPFDAMIDLHGDTLIYTTGGQSQATRFDRSRAIVTAPASCRDQPTGAQRRTTLRAGMTGGLLVVVRYSETSFPTDGPCAGVNETVNELVAVTLAKGKCTFQYSVAHKRSGPDPVDTDIGFMGAPCRAISTTRPRAPAIARGPTAARPVPAPTAAARPADSRNLRLARCILRGGGAQSCIAALGITPPAERPLP